MIYDRVNQDFEPSPTTVEAGLKVRKKSIPIAGVIHPGLHGIHGVTVDVVAVFLVVLLELVGMLMLIRVLAEVDFPIVGLLAGAAFAIIADFVLAITHHHFNAGKVTKLEVQRIISSQMTGTLHQTLVVNQLAQIQSKKRIGVFIASIIMLFAVLKFFFYYGTLRDVIGDEMPFAEVGVAAMVYAISWYIHVWHTGYALSWIWASGWLHGRDVSRFNRSGGTICTATRKRQSLKVFADFATVPQVGPHTLKLEKDPATGNDVYVLNAYGLLLDSEIDEFVNRMIDPEAKREFALKAMQLQLQYLGA